MDILKTIKECRAKIQSGNGTVVAHFLNPLHSGFTYHDGPWKKSDYYEK